MRHSGRVVLFAVLPLFLCLVGCDTQVVNLEEPEEVDSCALLVPVGIELVNDYVYTMTDADLGSTGGDLELLPEPLIELNERGQELDARLRELDCDVVAINAAVAEATAGLETDDPLIQVVLDSLRGGVVAPILPTQGEWVLESATVAGGTLEPVADHPITLVIEREAASGFAGCNGYFYPVRLADGVWSWAEGAATITELLCIDDAGESRDDVMNVENGYIRAFELVAFYELTDEALILAGDGVELRFVRSTGD